MGEKIVSICCITYNQEAYIARAIEGFLNQTYIDYCEILIHDDASTDNTLRIVEKYNKQYPDIIRVFPEQVNQYSLGDHQMCQRLFQKAKGRYIALCEGDDYWSDSHKIERQMKFMENNADYAMCFHAASFYDCRQKKEIRDIRFTKHSREVSIEEVISAGGTLIPTASLFFRREAVCQLPDFYYNCPVGDYPLQLYLAVTGRSYYMEQKMSVYCKYTQNSVSTQLAGTQEKRITLYKQLIKMLQEFSDYTQCRYEGAVEKRIHAYRFEIAYMKKNFSVLLRKPYRKYLFEKSPWSILKGLASCIMPKTYCNIKKIVKSS